MGEFNLTSRYPWTYGAGEVTFNDCTFNTEGKAILIYAESGVTDQTVNINGCTFNATKAGYTSSGAHCAAVEIDSSLISGTYTVNFMGDNVFDIADDAFAGACRIKASKVDNVIVNGVE